GDALPLLEEAAAASLTEPTLVTARPALLTACVEAGGSVPAETAARIGDLVEQLLVAEAATSAADGLERASQLSPFARALLGLGRYEAAARLTAECLGIRRATAPDDWATFRCESLHGRALLGQQRLRAAEAALLSGYRGLLERAARIPPAERGCVGLAAARLVTFYEAVGNDAEVAAWRRRVGAGADGR
ncbi:MAG: hypothetical protein KAI24_24635, partial [Planctomycetes bacterium]|nr:hypothetical protein [Planctomycetota bacterium]